MQDAGGLGTCGHGDRLLSGRSSTWLSTWAGLVWLMCFRQLLRSVTVPDCMETLSLCLMLCGHNHSHTVL